MRLTIDTGAEKLDDVLRVVYAAYGIEQAASEPQARTRARRSDRRGGNRKGAVGSRKRAASTAFDPTLIRRWALDNGYEVRERGALPRAVTDAYAAAHTG